jgi:hypothetical protein
MIVTTNRGSPTPDPVDGHHGHPRADPVRDEQQEVLVLRSGAASVQVQGQEERGHAPTAAERERGIRTPAACRDRPPV